ncbi:MAG: FAD-binding oxidoreductase [Bacteroidota bacterium]|nr:FAD-binding oxidoreductase [Bacteroidota bacterium]
MSIPKLIIGHGLSGSVLALTYYRHNVPIKLIGASHPNEASTVSSGLINPVTGRKYVKSWLIDEYIEAALDFYSWTESLLGKKYFFQVDIVRSLINLEALNAWENRSKDQEYDRYISHKRFEEFDRLGKPYGVVTGGYRLDVQAWLKDVHQFLVENEILEIANALISDPGDQYEHVIYATGAVGLPVSLGLIPNKGEALIVKMPEWKLPGIIKEDVFFVPLSEEHTYWIGSHYEPWSEKAGPTAEGKQALIKAIEQVYEGPFVILQHLAGLRPTMQDRRPLVGPYPNKKNNYLFNGMGTKGTSLAPYWAEYLFAYLENGADLPAIVNPARY